jgi:ElaB/YqjD/DUF883 family membrane-anchored ribosome-binding protein
MDAMRNLLAKASSIEKRGWGFLIVAGLTVAGALMGLGFAELRPGYASAVARVKVGQIDVSADRADSCQINPLQDVATVAEFLESPQAARSIAERLGRPDLAVSLTEARFGGFGNLTVRESPRFPIVQIRVKAKTEAAALAAVEAAANLLLEEQKSAEWNDDLKSGVDDARANYEDILRSYNDLANNVAQQSTAKDSTTLAQSMLLTIIRGNLHKSLVEARIAYDKARRQMDRAALLSTDVVQPATVEFSILAAPSRVAALGAIVGLLVGALVITFVPIRKAPPSGVGGAS